MDGRSSLSHAAEHGWDDGVWALSKRNADLDLKDVNGGSPLWWASRYGHKAVVEHLLGEGAFIETVDADGQSPLSVSSQHGHLSTVKVLLHYGADPNSSTKYGKTVLLFAVTAGRMDIVKMLLDSGADVNCKSPQGVTALSLAEEYGYSNLVDVIRAHMERDTSESGARISGHAILSTPEGLLDTRHCLWLLEASKNGNLAMIRRLIKSGVDLNCCIDDDTPLFEAAFHDQVKTVEVFIEHGAGTNVRTSDGNTALLHAADRGHASIVSLLLGSGASFEEKDNSGCSALLRAARSGRETTTSVLLQLGAITESKDNECGSPLWHASSNGHLNVVKLLLEYGANKECADASGRTPLTLAIEQRNLTVTRLLLHEGAQMRPESSQNCSSLCYAAEVGDEAIVDLLIDHGADLNYLSDNKRTALHMATLRGHIMIIRMLIEDGAKVDLRDADGRTALSLAKEAINNSAVKVLCQASRLRQASHRVSRKTDEERLKRTASYQYQPLTRESSIRVIELHPGMPCDIIRFDLNEAQLKDNAFFEAVSYEWRDKFGSVPVQCDDRQILITPNCKEVMENLRLCSKPRYLWIDAICINQEDDQERNQQVAMMTDIFRTADKVLMWVGQETDATRAAFDVLPIMAEAHHMTLQAAEKPPLHSESVGEDNDPQKMLRSVLQDEVSFDAFMDLVNRSYWTRAWIFQEVVIGGSRGVCISGSQSCEWTVLRSALLAYNDCPSRQHFSVIAGVADRFSNTGNVSLVGAAWVLHDLKATDPRDKIFAALGLASTVKSLVERPTADYTMTVEEVYVQATRYILDTEDIDEAWSLGIRQSDKAFPGLPSWVPDFVFRKSALWVRTFEDSELLHGLNIVERPITTETSLEIGGCIVNKVVFKLTITGELDLYSILSCAMSTVARQNHSIYDAYPVGKEIMTDDGSEDAPTPNEDKCRLPNNANAKALLTTLMDFSKLSANEENTMTEDMFDSIMIGFLTWSLSRGTETPEQWNETPSYAQKARKIWADKSNDDRDLLEFELQNLTLMGDLLRHFGNLVFTENGYFGLTYHSKAEEGMVVALVGQDNRLRLLRKGAGPERYYEYVDQVYLNFLGENRLEKVFGEVKLERLRFR